MTTLRVRLGPAARRTPDLLDQARERSPSPASIDGSSPPAALAIHLCIGMSYGLSVFWLPLERMRTRRRAQPMPARGDATSVLGQACALFTAMRSMQLDGDWTLRPRLDLHARHRVARHLGGVCSAAGSNARTAQGGFVAALCWGGGFIISALGVYLHQLWIIWLSALASSAASASASAISRRSRRW